MQKPATLLDVAREARVSIATVSRSLTTPARVTEATRAAVLAAVERTGYRVNHTARNLRRQRTGTVVVLVPNLANPFFSKILSSLASVLTQAGYAMLVADTQDEPSRETVLRRLLEGGIADGLVVLDGTVTLPEDNRLPTLAACEWQDDGLPSVTVENADGLRRMVGHLAGLGHRAIGHVTGPAGNVLTRTRLEGFRQGLGDNRLDPDRAWIAAGDFSVASGAAAGHAWLALEERPTAVACASDAMACGFIDAVRRAGVDVPGDVSVVGFDDIELMDLLTPALTTVRQPRHEIGLMSARTILGLIEGRQPGERCQTLPIELVIRDSADRPAQPRRSR